MKYNFIDKILEGEFTFREDLHQTGKDFLNIGKILIIPAIIAFGISSIYLAKEKMIVLSGTGNTTYLILEWLLLFLYLEQLN